MRYLILMLFLFLKGCFGISQSISISIKSIKQTKDDLELIVSLNSTYDDSIQCYRPVVEDFCSSILDLTIINNKMEKFNYFPCEYIVDLDHIKLGKSNSFFLKRETSFEFSLQIEKKYFPSSLLDNNSLDVILSLNFLDVEFETTSNNVFAGKLQTSFYLKKYSR